MGEPRTPEEDPNLLAYKASLDAGEFAELSPDTWVAFRDGKLVGSAPNKGELFDSMRSQTEAKSLPAFVTQVKEESRKPVRLHGFFTDPQGGLRRGIPTWVKDEEGNEMPAYLEFGSNTVYPREEHEDSE